MTISLLLLQPVMMMHGSLFHRHYLNDAAGDGDGHQWRRDLFDLCVKKLWSEQMWEWWLG
jgi:hypothetical protein